MTKHEDGSPAELIDARIEELGDWRGKTLARVRELIHEGEEIVGEALKDLVTAAVALNQSRAAERRAK